jgi:hypothetical protein
MLRLLASLLLLPLIVSAQFRGPAGTITTSNTRKPGSGGAVSVTSGGGGNVGVVGFDGVYPSSTAMTNGGSSDVVVSWGHIVGGGTNRALTVVYSISDNTAVTVLWVSNNTTATVLTKIAKVLPNNSASSGDIGAWGMAAPAVGSNFITARLTAAPFTASLFGSISYTNVDQATPWTGVATNAGSGITATVTVTSQANDMVGVVCGDGSGITARSATLRWKFDHDLATGAGNAEFQTAAGSASVSPTFTAPSDFWGCVGWSMKHD